MCDSCCCKFFFVIVFKRIIFGGNVLARQKNTFTLVAAALCAFVVTPTFAKSHTLSSERQVECGQRELTITRDGFGVPTLKGGNLVDIARAIGRVQAEDRLWQIFEVVIVYNGRASTYFGPSFLDSDIFQRQINYTDAEVQDQIDKYFTIKTRTVYENFVLGLNDRVAEVNADPSIMPYELKALGFGPLNPLPPFTVYDILRANQGFSQGLNTGSIPMYQLTNLSNLDLLIANFGQENAMAIFNDIDPTTAQVKSLNTIVPNHDCRPPHVERSQAPAVSQTAVKPNDRQLNTAAADSGDIGKELLAIQKLRDSYGLPKFGSNGVAINGNKSASGNPMIRIAPQTNFNQPSDFYQIRIDENKEGIQANYFTIASAPFVSLGVFNKYGVALQVGNLPANDFLFESINNIDPTQTRQETIQVAGSSDVVITVYRSTSGGWVIERPIPSDPNTMLTLRSVFLGKQLRFVNTFVESAFAADIHEFIATGLDPAYQSDVLLQQGELVDSKGNIAAFHFGGWTKLPQEYDRRLPQGISQNPAPSNAVYSYKEIAKTPLKDCNTKQGYYIGWNTLFKQRAEGSANTIEGGLGVNRVHWLNEFLASRDKVSFDDLKLLNVHQAIANSNIPFDTSSPNEDADRFVVLFRQRFFNAVKRNPTPERLQAIAFLENYKGDWFTGDLNNILNGSDVSDQFILASVWVNSVASTILNPYLAGTTTEVAQSIPGDPLPDTNSLGFFNTLTKSANTLSRILQTACDNTIFFDGWLEGQPSVDDIIVSNLDYALNTVLGGFAAQPWGAGKRGTYFFNNAILGPVASMNMLNASSLYIIAEFNRCGAIRMETIIPLGESGEILGTPPGAPIFNIHCFDQQPFFTGLQLRANPPFKNVECAIDLGICKQKSHKSQHILHAR